MDLELLDARFNVRANDIFIGIHAGRLLDAMQQAMPRATLCFVPEEDDLDDDALRSGRVDLFISASRPLGHEIRVQPLFSIRVVGVAREDHPCSRTRSRRAAWRAGAISASRAGARQGPIDDALARLGLDRHVALVVPTASSALLALQGSDLILPLPEPLAWQALRMGMKIRAFELPLALDGVLITQAWHPRHQMAPRINGCAARYAS